MDLGKYLSSSPGDQIRMMIKAMREQQERLKPENNLTASPVDKLLIMIQQQEEEQRKIESGYYQTAPFHEQIVFIAKQIQEQVRKEVEREITDIKYWLEILENQKRYLVIQLDQIDKDDPNCGNLKETNTLLDKLISVLKSELEKKMRLDDLESK